MRALFARHALVLYFAVTFASSWLLWLVSGVLARQTYHPALDNGWLVAQIGVFCPSLWALVCSAVLHRDLRRRNLALLLMVYLPAVLLGLLIAGQGVKDPDDLPPAVRLLVPAFGLAVVALLLFSRKILLVRRAELGGRTFCWLLASAAQLPLFFLFGWLVLALSGRGIGIGALERGLSVSLPGIAVLFSFDMIFGGALGEEIGWRGFALPRLLERQSPLRASLTLGVIWALWHLPIDLTAGFGVAGLGGVLFRLLFAGSLSVIITWYFIRSGHGLMCAFLIHATVNWLPLVGFTGYHLAMGLLLLLMYFFSLLVGLADERFTSRPGAGSA